MANNMHNNNNYPDIKKCCEGVLRGLEATAADMRHLMTGLMVRINELEERVRTLSDNNQTLMADNQALTDEVQSLQTENLCMAEDREMMRKELREVRHENDLLSDERRNWEQTSSPFARHVASAVEQFMLKERPNSMQTFGSYNQMDGQRLPAEELETYHSTRGIVTSNPTSNETFFDARSSSQRSSAVANAIYNCLPMNAIPSVMTAQEQHKLNQTLVSLATASSQSFGFDVNDNLKLKLVRVPLNRAVPVYVAYVRSPSDFWLHIDLSDVIAYSHVIQVKQGELVERGTARLTTADVEIGMYCAAVYSVDGDWYRAQVIDIHYENDIEKDSIRTIRVQFIDWGNCEEVPLAKVMRLSVELTKRKQAVQCHIQGIGLETHQWDKESVTKFREAMEKAKKLSATFLKARKLDERLDSLIYPVDVLIIKDTGETENVVDYVTLPLYVEPEDTEPGIENNVSEECDRTLVASNSGPDVVSN
ncbi:unnamed protein product, partial [Medioppia subpectinata]